MTRGKVTYPEGNRRRRGMRTVMTAAVLFVSLLASRSFAQTQVGNYASHATSGRSVVITGATGESIRITPYGDYIVRVQVAKKGESFYADDRYEIVASARLGGHAGRRRWRFVADPLDRGRRRRHRIALAKQPMRLAFSLKGQDAPVLSEENGVTWSGNTITESFSSDHGRALRRPRT